MSRLETGPVQCGDDWPGIFIRGDNALSYAMALEVCLDMMKHCDDCRDHNIIEQAVLEGLRETLMSCQIGCDPEMIQKDEKCLKEQE